ncbi:sigma-70 family RNA polymerase sigma factor [Paenibacillus endoradicis]|uniref:sigma-70 family RNA polymerase sigma factor n=1 Tax=Paenibacillus endoradicis TaxID=2972487 RepID=UPI002158C520|nr:sigma-70 family RNA polymerase sigma factor [Paenibacillus endoradicis]MCR8659698.1 sigma-70 family RNA polymerase sigma factor [Paenibacillus endoradicis]
MNNKSSCLNPEQTIELMEIYKVSECNDIATELLLHYKPLIRMAAVKMSRSRPDLFEDLFQVAQLSMLRLFKQYDHERAIPFEGYAMKSLIGHLKNYLRDKSWYIQVPRRIKEKGLLIQKSIDHLTITLQRSPNIDEIAAHMDLTVEETIEILSSRESYQYISLDTPLSTDNDSATIGDLIDSQVDEYKAVEHRIDLEDALEHLKEEERNVLNHIYHNDLSQRTIAQQLGISQMSVSRIQKRAIMKLQRILAHHKLDE